MVRFILILTLVTILTFTYAVISLGMGLVSGILLFVPFLLIWLLPVLYWGRGGKKESGLSHFIHYAGFLAMAFISFLFVFLLLADIAGIFYPVLYKREIVLALSLFSLLLGHFIARSGPSVIHVKLPIEALPPELKGFTFAHITDLHIGLTIRKNYVEKVVEKTLKENTDLIVLTGDIADGDLKKYGDDSEPLRRLGETGKAWMVPGNHDYYSNWPLWKKKFSALGIKILENDYTEFPHLLLGGVTDPAASERPDPRKAINLKSEKFKVLLAHNPKLAKMSADAGFDLMLSGHTHAGQFFPWTFVVKMVHRPHYGGISDEGKMKVYVGPGTGTWGPPVRLGTTPEIAIITLCEAAASG